MKLLYFQHEAWEKEYLASRLPKGVAVEFFPQALSALPELADHEAEILSVFTNSPIGAAELDRFPGVKLIATRSTGFDHIDLEEVKKRGIVVSNVPGYGEHTVAEYAIALLLTLSRRIYSAYKRIEDHSDFSTTGLRGFDLAGKTIGIVGTGRIGKWVIKIARGLEMKVLAYDIFPDQAAAAELGFSYVGLDELLSRADIVSLHTPYTPETHHLISFEAIKKMKRGVYLINTARGALVETGALVKGLEEGIIGGAGLDVLEEEGMLIDETKLLTEAHPELESLRVTLANHYLMEHPNVIITPHNAFNTKEAIERIVDVTIGNVTAFITGTPSNVVA